MKLAGVIGLNALGNEWFEYVGQLQPVSNDHPPSLKNPKKVRVENPGDGWHRGDSKKARDKALNDLIEVHKRLRRQIGKPEVSQVAAYPTYPAIVHWT